MKTQRLYPFKFKPIAHDRVWGGNTLALKYNKPFDPDKKIGESWEIFSMDSESPVIENGYLAGNTLSELLETYMGELVGEEMYNYYSQEFALLIKLLDINEMLSVQVHPDDEVAMERHGSYGKNEAWFILEAKPGSKIYMGFNRDVTAAEFYEKCLDNSVTEILNEISPKAGDFIYVKAGTVHAAGDGVVIAEVQQASDVTYRVYDWGREHNPETAREMHLEEAIDCIEYGKYRGEGIYLKNVAGTLQLTNNPYFTINHINIEAPQEINSRLYKSFIIYFAYDQPISITWSGSQGPEITLEKGEFTLIPASLGYFTISPKQKQASFLEIFINDISSREDYPEEDPYLFYDENIPENSEGIHGMAHDDDCQCGCNDKN